MKITNCLVGCLAICSSFCLLSCSGSGGTKLDFEDFTVEKAVKISNDLDSPECSVKMKLKKSHSKDAKLDSAINGCIGQKLFDLSGLDLKVAADSFANKYTSDYKTNLAKFYAADRGNGQRLPWYQYRYDLQTDVKQDYGIACMIVDLDFYEGGAHGIKQKLTVNFDTSTGKQLSLNDIFVEGFTTKVTEKLLELLRKKADADNITELHDKGYLYSMDMFASDNFILNDGKLTFIYNPYEIAPYDKGIITLEIDEDYFKEFLNERYN